MSNIEQQILTVHSLASLGPPPLERWSHRLYLHRGKLLSHKEQNCSGVGCGSRPTQSRLWDLRGNNSRGERLPGSGSDREFDA
jgi:hypothetical protein